MKDFCIGKRLYSSTALMHIKMAIMAVALWIIVNLYFETYQDPDFLAMGELSLQGVIKFHSKYPAQILGFIFGTFLPAFYYSFIRKIIFYEEGIVVNRGLPFLNHCVKYSDIENFKIVHSKYLMSIKRKDVQEEILFTIQDIDRAVAILDQHAIMGDLKSQIPDGAIPVSRKIMVYFFIFGVVVSIMQYTGAWIAINRLLFR
jgi:hypothetical protein